MGFRVPQYLNAAEWLEKFGARDGDREGVLVSDPSAISDTPTPNRQAIEREIFRAEDDIDKFIRTSFLYAGRYVQETGHFKISGVRRPFYPGMRAESKFFLLLSNAPVVSITSMEFSQNTSWTDWVATYTEGLANDYWVEYRPGIIFFRTVPPRGCRYNIKYYHGNKVWEHPDCIAHYTGTITSTTGMTFDVSGSSWTVDEFQGKVVKFTSGTLSGTTRLITGNDADTITVTGAALTGLSTNTFEVYTVPRDIAEATFLLSLINLFHKDFNLTYMLDNPTGSYMTERLVRMRRSAFHTLLNHKRGKIAWLN